MGLRQYVCNFYKELQIGKAVKFSNGFFETSNPELQRLIESNSAFGVHIHHRDSVKEMERVGREREEAEAQARAKERKRVLKEIVEEETAELERLEDQKADDDSLAAARNRLEKSKERLAVVEDPGELQGAKKAAKGR